MTWNEDRLLPYQWRMVSHIEDHQDAMLWADMGLGKTVCALTAIARLQANLEATAVLVVAPLRIIQSVWRQEAEKWEHTRHLRFSLIHGAKEKRITALWRKVDIYLVNYENLVWLATEIQHRYISKGKRPPFDMVVYDEVTKVKNVTTNRGKAWAKLLPYFSRRIGLTGEPASNGYKDLHGQFFFVDQGKRLGVGSQQFRERFLRPAGYGGFDWIATVTGREQIHRRISDITLELAAKDYIDLPELKTNTIWVDLPREARRVYDELEKEFFAELASGAELEVLNEASKINKLLQIASGAAYYNEGAWEEIHKAKIEALQDAVEEAGGRPMLLGYTYRHEAARIAQALPEKPLSHSGATFLSSKLGEKAVADIIRRWEFDEIPLLCGHPACLHPSTEVLTEHRGWRRIVEVLPWERVFDGIEFVSHSGCYLSGHKEVVDVFGVKMTPDHKLWVNGRWEEAASVRNRPGARREALYQYQGHDQGKADQLSQQGDDRGRGRRSRENLSLQPGETEKIPVYDLVDCGPRHQFVIRNTKGECFLSHNSMGHGLNLQGSSARAAIWFSLPWSLELYNQLNGRLFGGHRRQGASVVHHILARDTVDEVVYETLQSKSGTQAGLRAAIKQYWEKRR